MATCPTCGHRAPSLGWWRRLAEAEKRVGVGLWSRLIADRPEIDPLPHLIHKLKEMA